MFSVRRPSELVVLNCWVTETNVAPCLSSTSMIRAKSSSERVSRSTLYTTTQFAAPASISAEQPLQRGPVHVGAGVAAVVVLLRQGGPAFVTLAVDEGLGRLALGVQRIERLIESFVGGLPGVDGAADGGAAGRPVCELSRSAFSGQCRFSLAQAEEAITIPLRACDLLGDRAQRSEPAAVVFEAVVEHPDDVACGL